MDLKAELKKMLVEELKLEDVEPEDITDDEPLFEEGLGLDSLDAVELIVFLQKRYGVDIEDSKQGREAFASINAMADYIEEHRGEMSRDG